MNQQPLRGRLKAKPRSFEKVVRDLRHVVFSVVRVRPLDAENVQFTVLGSGFFVSPTVFLTSCHVVNGRAASHQDGDSYHLVSSFGGSPPVIYFAKDARQGSNLHLFPDCDLALLIHSENREKPYAALDYADVYEGREIGVAGYPIAVLQAVEGKLTLEGFKFRVAKGVVTGAYITNINFEGGVELRGIPVIEVNFLFVPGNSGGPIFDAETGRILGFVHGYTTTKIRERVEQVTLIPDLPADMTGKYVECLSALYSLGIKLDLVRPQLEQFGVTL
jgi:S1-C subfamily serine protease